MDASLAASPLPSPPAKVFLVGIGGIGMSGLAQYLHARGYRVAGSDRQLGGPGRTELMASLRVLGVQVFPQDGSGPRSFLPDLVIASSAVEEGNSDFIASAAVPRIPRAVALAALLEREAGLQIAVAGSAGKTSVTGWIASALRVLGHGVLVVNGGFMRELQDHRRPGNFSADNPSDMIVVEVDESDKSLTAFTPDIGILLNVGTDHYSRSELLEVFAHFLDGCRVACVLPWNLAGTFAGHGPRTRLLFGARTGAPPDAIVPDNYRCTPAGAAFDLRGIGCVRCGQFGRHSTLNAAAAAAAIRLADPAGTPASLAQALAHFQGIRQRVEKIGLTANGLPVYHDYAHNVQKIVAAVQTAREAVGSPLTVIFQPHGFKPLAFMRAPLRTALLQILRPDDLFVLLPVYYAGGSACFEPSASDVADDFAAAGLPARAVSSREQALDLAASRPGNGALLLLGARDPSLPAYARRFCVTDAEMPAGREASASPSGQG